MLSACISRWELVASLLHGMRINGLRETLEAYDDLLSACYRAQIWDVAMTTFSRSGSPTALSIHACGNRWSHALALHAAASTASCASSSTFSPLLSPSSSLEVDSALVQCVARASQWRTAQQVLLAMEDESVRAGGGCEWHDP